MRTTSGAPSRRAGTAPFVQLSADFQGVAAEQLRDAGALSGLMIAAAGAAGFTTIGAPMVRRLPSDGVAAILMLDGCHMTLHAFPERELLLLDILTIGTRDVRKALEVFARRLPGAVPRSDIRPRG